MANHENRFDLEILGILENWSLRRDGRNRKFDFIDKLTVLTTFKKTESDIINILNSGDMEITPEIP